MPVKTKPTVYIASDGTEFKSASDAERYDVLILAKRNYDNAFQSFSKAVLETQQTKDGKPFDLKRWNPYWIIRRTWGEVPQLEKVALMYTSISLGADCHGEILFCMERDPRVRIYESVYARYPIHELYSSESAAKVALVEAMKEYAIELENDIKRCEALVS